MRTVVVLGTGGELAVALRERLDRAWVTVLDVEGDDRMPLIATCQPWPWMLVGDGADVPAAVIELVRHRPVLLRWLGAAPRGMPGHCRVLARFADLVESVNEALVGSIGTMRLAVGAGVVIDGGVHVNAELEALLGEWPEPLDLPRSRFRTAEALVQRCAPEVRLMTSASGTRLALA